MLSKLGPYRFKGVLGRGGMGTVYHGLNEATGEEHAVKVLAPNFNDDDHFRSRFESEIKALLRLDHPNIVRLISFGQDQGNLFFAMELVDGQSLFGMRRSGHQFTWRECLSIGMDICQGLRHAHDRGIVHRDLKPGNLMMTTDGVVKITDFGIAKTFGASLNTGTNIVGTMDFMSPEQAKGEIITAKSDIYSLGAVLFTLLSGKPPFASSSMEEAFRNLTRVAAPNISTIVPNVPHELDQLIGRMLEKNPDKRLATALAALHKIKEIQQQLKGSSEAKTTAASGPPLGRSTDQKSPKKISNRSKDATDVGQNPPKSASRPTVDDIAAHRPLAQEKTKIVDRNKTAVQQTVDESHTAVDVVARHLLEEDSQNSLSSEKRDYYNRVTDAQRTPGTEADGSIDNSPGRGFVAIALTGVVLLALFGVYWVYRSPAADDLYAEISANRESPETVIEQTSQFAQLYPQDDRIEEVRLLNEIGTAMLSYRQLSNRLKVRSGFGGDSSMTEIERQFYGIVELAVEDETTAIEKMKAFKTVHQSNRELSDRDQACVDAVKGFFYKIKSDAAARFEERIDQIKAAMTKAENTPDDAAAIRLYQSLIRLYRDENWGDRDDRRIVLLRDVGKRLQQRISQKQKSDQQKQAAPPETSAPPEPSAPSEEDKPE